MIHYLPLSDPTGPCTFNVGLQIQTNETKSVLDDTCTICNPQTVIESTWKYLQIQKYTVCIDSLYHNVQYHYIVYSNSWYSYFYCHKISSRNRIIYKIISHKNFCNQLSSIWLHTEHAVATWTFDYNNNVILIKWCCYYMMSCYTCPCKCMIVGLSSLQHFFINSNKETSS